MRLLDDGLSKIRTTRHHTNGAITYDFEWVGDTDVVAITFELLEDGDPELLGFCQRSEIFVGDEAWCGPFKLKMVDVDYQRRLIYCERV